MAALTAITPTVTGTASPPGNVAASDTISADQLGSKGCTYEVLNGNASPDNMTISDFGQTPAGNSLTSNQIAPSVTNGTNKTFVILPSQVNPATGLVTITHSVQTTVTYKLVKIP